MTLCSSIKLCFIATIIDISTIFFGSSFIDINDDVMYSPEFQCRKAVNKTQRCKVTKQNAQCIMSTFLEIMNKIFIVFVFFIDGGREF